MTAILDGETDGVTCNELSAMRGTRRAIAVFDQDHEIFRAGQAQPPLETADELVIGFTYAAGKFLLECCKGQLRSLSSISEFMQIFFWVKHRFGLHVDDLDCTGTQCREEI